MRTALALMVVLPGLLTFGCAQAGAPMRVRYADVDKGALQAFTGEVPLIVEFQPGERLPVSFSLTADVFKLEPEHPALELVVTQHCFLRIGPDGFRMSLDPENFDRKPSEPGSFRIGFGQARGESAKVTVEVAAPRH